MSIFTSRYLKGHSIMADASRIIGKDGDPFQGMPWQVKAVAIVGAPILISLFLIWSIDSRLVGTVNDNHSQLQTIRTEAVEHDKRVSASFEQLKEQSNTNERLLRMICFGVQKTEEAKQGCWK